ncbi:MAG TPA: FG-GAP-like repeat-containing protein [Rudaea sp.]|nr:FG-GAP-like repeat-containing protein [Rudaea sp.]
MLFPVTRSSDTSYAAVLNYHTMDGTAIAGTDYTAVTSSIVIPTGSTTANIPVTLAANTTGNISQTFQLLLDATTGIGPAPGFGTQQQFSTGAFPFFVTAADVNGDGIPDLIVANFSSNTVSVLINTTAPGAATPTFAAQQTFATGNEPISVTTADLNGDGKPDLIVTNYASNTVSVLLNTTAPGATTASFSAQQTFATGINPHAVTAVDVNGDGKADLIVADYGDSTVSVLLNTTSPGAATPSFAANQTFFTGAYPTSVAAADVNGDGEPDLIVANHGSNTVSVLLNTTVPGTATPSFAAQQAFATGSGPYGAATVDVNGDGKPDLILTNANDNTVSVLLNTTAPGAVTPTFAAQQTFATGSGPYSVAASDINGDGKADLIVANDSDNTVSVLLNATAPGAGTPTFAAKQTYAAGSGPFSVAAADMNGDGKPDMVVANVNGNTVSVLLNTTAPPTAPPNFATQQTFAAGSSPLSVIAADVNGDGKLDLVAANQTANSVSVLLNTTVAGAIMPSFSAQNTFATGSTPNSIAIGDLNGDGKPDLVVTNSGGATVSVLLNNTTPGATTPIFATQQTFATGNNPHSVAIADINGDGKPDLIVTNRGDSTVSVLLNTTPSGAATPTFSAQVTFPTGTGLRSVAAVDINGDGSPDLIVANQNDDTVSVLLNTTPSGAATPSFGPQQTFSTGTGTGPRSVTAADINGDGKPDLIVANQTNGTVAVLLNTTTAGATTASFVPKQPFATGANPLSVISSDVNGDGKPDLVVANSTDNTVSVLLNATTPGSATANFVSQQVFATAQGPAAVTAADINGDGKPDLIAADFNNASVSVLLNTQYQPLLGASSVTGTIVHDYIFADGFGP